MCLANVLSTCDAKDCAKLVESTRHHTFLLSKNNDKLSINLPKMGEGTSQKSAKVKEKKKKKNLWMPRHCLHRDWMRRVT